MNDSCRRIRLDAFISVYVEQYLKARDPRSWRKELGRLRRIQEYFGEVWIDDLDAAAVEGFLADLRRAGLKPATINRYHARLSSMMKRAWAWGYRNDNPLRHIERLRESKMGDRYLEADEFRMLLDACDPDLRALVVVAAYTGMRRGELMALRWQDVDLDAGCLIVRADHSKTAESRTVPLNTEVRKVLQGMGPVEEGRVFPFKEFPRYRWDKVRRRLGWDQSENPRLRRWRFHDLRHDCASRLVMADVPIAKVAKILGHKELMTTQRYAHLADRSLFEAMERIARK